MKLTEFVVGKEFWMSEARYLCTDIGKRTVIAIRVEDVVIRTTRDGASKKKSLTYTEAKNAGWFNGPPYAVLERVIDENDQEICYAKKPKE